MGRVKKQAPTSESSQSREKKSGFEVPSPANTEEGEAKGILTTLSLAKIDRTTNYRKRIGDTGELKASIKVVGLLEPIQVAPINPDTGLYPLISGGRRCQAMEELGYENIDCLIKREIDLPSEQQKFAKLITNIQRADVDAAEEAEYIRLLCQEGPQGEIAKKLGKSKAWVTQKLRHAQLSIEHERARELDSTTAYEIFKSSPNPSERKKLIDGALASDIGAREFIKASAKEKKTGSTEKSTPRANSPILVAARIETLKKIAERTELRSKRDFDTARESVKSLRAIATLLARKIDSSPKARKS